MFYGLKPEELFMLSSRVRTRMVDDSAYIGAWRILKSSRPTDISTLEEVRDKDT